MTSRSFNKRPALTLPLILTCCVLGVTGCSTVRPMAKPALPVSLTEPCRRPDPAGVFTVGDLAAHSLRQDAAISVCDSARKALVKIIEGPEKPKRKLWLW